jgi:surface polysaccharide O-acyltransferase-like enzyme
VHVTQPAIARIPTNNSFSDWGALVLDAQFHSSVPIFIMISGALLLSSHSKLTLKQFYVRRLKRIIPPFLFYLLVYFFWSQHTGLTLDFKTYLIKTFVYGTPYFHLYFIYVILGLYVFTPWIKKLVENTKPNETLLLTIIILLITSAWQFSTNWFTKASSGSFLFSTSQFLPFLGYFLLGYLLHRSNHIDLKKILISTTLCLVIFQSLIQWFFIKNFGNSPLGFLPSNYVGSLLLPLSVMIFLMTKNLTLPKLSKIVIQIGNASL